MGFDLFSNYLIAIFSIPFVVLTIKSVIKNADSLFDEELSNQDRALLKQFTCFVLLPLIVLFHELGHAIIALALNAQITGFHWSLFWGEVVLKGALDPQKLYFIALAGNLFELLAGFFALAIALLAQSPAIVALAIYVYSICLFHCLLAYPLLSFARWNYDFAMIYGSDLSTTLITALLHLALIAFFLYSYFGAKPRLNFNAKTRPSWYKQLIKIEERAKKEPQAINYLALGWQYYLVGLNRQALDALDKAQNLEPTLLEIWLLHGYIEQNKGHYLSATTCFEEIEKAGCQNLDLLARSFMARGHCLMEEAEKARKPNYDKAIAAYTDALNITPQYLDPYYYLALTFIAKDEKEEALVLIRKALQGEKAGLTWQDSGLSRLNRSLLTSLK
jgi:tetratricopeptide (TPR) repeat protein